MENFRFDIQRFIDEDDFNLTDEEKERIRKSSLPHLRMLSIVAKNPLFEKFTDALDVGEGTVNFLSRDVAPLFSFFSGLYKRKFGKDAKLHLVEDAAIFASSVKIIDQILEIYDACADFDVSNLPPTLGNKVPTIINEALKIANNVGRKNGDDGFFLSVVTSGLSYGISLLSTLDGMDSDEQAAINKALVKLGGTTIKQLIKELLKDGNDITIPFGLFDLGLSAAVGLVEGISQYETRLEYYRDDGLPEDYALKEAIAEAVLIGMNEGSSEYLKGIDVALVDLGYFIIPGCKWIYEQVHAFFTDKNYTEFECSALEKSYMEALMDIAKMSGFGTTNNDDYFELDDPSTVLYTQDGNDVIKNIHSYVTILAGHGNDSISLYEGAKYNSVVSGNGNDYIYSNDDFGTLNGGKDDDLFLIVSSKNQIFGESGKDIIFNQGNANTITAGTGNDIIDLNGATNTVIEYAQGDGTDAIYGYDASTLIKVKGEYSTHVSGNDAIIQVGKGGLIVKDAAGLKLNINKIELAEGETLPSAEGALISNPYDNAVILMPGLWGTERAIRGTNGNDYIENTLSNIMIYGLDGDDTIINRGTNVTINSGTGNDSIINYGATVKINGGDNDDYIYNEAARVTIDGANGKDIIDNSGNNSRIDGGNDMDNITNRGENTNINSGTGNDNITNLASNARISGYDDTNYITNNKSNVTIDGGDDDSVIYSSGNNVSINAGGGNNSVSIDGSAGGYQTVVAGNGKNTIQVGERDETEEKRYYNRITVGDGNNYIDNSNVERSSIYTGDGNDTIITGGGYTNYYHDGTSIVAGAGDNRITVNSNMTRGEIYAGAGNDLVSMVSGGSNNIISISSGDDTVIAWTNNSTINVGAGKNFVSLYGTGDSIIAGSGDDSVIMTYSGGGNYASLGSGNNTLVSTNGRENITAGDGNDLITVRGGNLNLGGGKNNISITYGGDTTINTGSDDDTINVADKAEEATEGRYRNNINAGDGNNYINNSNVERSSIYAGSGNDTIITGGGEYNIYNNFIVAGAGDNRITVNSYMTRGEIYAGAGNDLVSVGGGGYSNQISIGNGDDTVIADIWDSTINVGAGKNFVSLNNGGNSIIAGNGDDYVTMTGGGNTTSLGSGNNTLVSENGRETVTAGDGDDLITVRGGNINVGGGKNNVSITYGGNTTINTGADDDTINVADKAEEATEARYYHKINAGDGNNYINNSNVERSSIYAGSGNDTIITGGGQGGYYNSDPKTSISAGAGDNRITVNSSMRYGEIYAGGGNDFVSLGGEGSNNIISVGDGRNTVFTSIYYDTNYNTNNNITAGTGSDLIRTSGKNSFINAGSGRNSITLTGGNNNTIVTGKGNDTITLGDDANNNVIIFGGGNDLVVNYTSGSTVKSIGALIRSTVGSDVVLTDGVSKMTLKGAADKTVTTATLPSNDNVYKILVADKDVGDTLLPDKIFGDTVSGTSADDTISNSEDNVLISGGAGDDYIINTGVNVVFAYNEGDGDDSIKGFNSTSTLRIGGGNGTYATQIRDSDVIVTVGDGSVTLLEAAGKDLNIEGEEISAPAWTFKGTKAIYGTKNETLLQVSGVTSLDGITLNGKTVTLTAKSLGTDKVTVSDGYTLALADDVPTTSTSAAGWSFKGANALYKSAETTAGYRLADNQISYVAASGGETLATVTGLKTTEGIQVDETAKIITLPEEAVGTDKISISGNYLLALDEALTTYNVAPVWTLNGTTAEYKNALSAHYSIAADGKSISFVRAAVDKNSDALITVTGLKKNLAVDEVGDIAGITVDAIEKTLTIAADVLNETSVAVSGDYKFVLANDVPRPVEDEPTWKLSGTKATLQAGSTAGYTLANDGKKITYSADKSDKILATITGLKTKLKATDLDAGITIDDGTITLGKGVLGTTKVTVDGDYTLALGDDVDEAQVEDAAWTVKGTTATFAQKQTKGYAVSENGKFITYAAKDTNLALATVSGLAKGLTAEEVDAGISIDDTTITLSKAVLGTTKVTAKEKDFTLALADDVAAPAEGEQFWSVKGTTATLQRGTTEGYTCDGKAATFTAAKKGTTLATISGLAKGLTAEDVDAGINVDGATIKLSAASLGTSNVKLTKGDYTLEVDESLQEPTTGLGWNVSGTTATYKNTASAYYTASGKTITFHKAATVAGAEDVIKLQGLKKNLAVDVNGDISGITIDELEKTVTLSADVLNKTTVKITGEYALALDDDVQESTADEPELEIKKTTATLKQKTPAGYVLNDSTITYVKKETATTLATITGLSKSATEDDITVNGETITMTATALGNKVGVNGAGYEFAVDGDYSGTITGSKAADIITVNGAGATINAGKGDDQLTSGGGNTFLYASGDGDDVIADFSTDDALKVTSGTAEVTTDGADVVVTITKGKTVGTITLTDAAGQTISILDKKGKATTHPTEAYTAADSDPYWFIDDDFETTPQLADITAEVNSMLGEMDFNDAMQLVQTTPVTCPVAENPAAMDGGRRQ